MTRGKLVLVVNKDTSCMVSTEFNGDMYPSGYGAVADAGRTQVKNLGDFQDLVKKFVKGYGYNERDEEIHPHKLAGTLGDYYQNWFSDYLYIKNICGRDIVVTDKNGNELELPNNGIVVLDFGVKVPDAELQLDMSEAQDSWFSNIGVERNGAVVLGVSDEFREWFENEAEEEESVFIGDEKERVKYFHAVVGVSIDGRVVYDRTRLLACLVADGLSEEDAEDHLAYNIEGSLPGLGEKAPIIMRSFSD